MPSRLSMRSRCVLLPACALLVAAASFAPYWQTRSFDFITLDDWDFVVGNAAVQAGLCRSSVAWAFQSEYESGCWQPVAWLSHLAEASLFGVAPKPMHLTNALMHAFGAALALIVLLRLTGSLPGALAGALLWSLHPLRVESVAWIASRKDVLCVPFLLLACWAHLRALGSIDSGRSWRRHGWTTLWFALALMSKPTAVVFPVLMLVVEGVTTGRVQGRGLRWPVVLALASVVETLRSQGVAGALKPAAALTFVQRAVNAVATVGATLVNTVYPHDLTVPYLFAWPVNPLHFAVGALLLAATGVLLALRVRRWHFSRNGIHLPGRSDWDTLLGAMVWFVAAMAPVSGIVGFGYQARADRHTYLPALGISLALAVVVRALWRVRVARPITLSVALVCLLALGAVTVRQTALWRNDGTLFRHGVKVTKGNYVAHGMLATYAYGVERDLETAAEQFGCALSLQEDALPRAQIALIALERRDLAEVDKQLAAARLREASDPGYRTLLAYLLGLRSYLDGDFGLAEKHLWTAYHAGFQSVLVCYPMGLVHQAQGKTEEAAKDFRLAARGPMFRFLPGSPLPAPRPPPQ